MLPEHLLDRLVRVDRQRENFPQHLGLGKARRLHVDLRLADAGLDQVPGVLAVQDGEIALVAEHGRVLAQDAVADGMKRAAPERGQLLPQQIRHAPHHFPGGLVGERQQQDAVRRNALLQQVGHAVGERARLARARAGDDQRRPRRRGDGGELLLVQFARVVNRKWTGARNGCNTYSRDTPRV